MSASLLVYCVGAATRSGLCPIAKETAEAAPTLCTEYGSDGWMGWNDMHEYGKAAVWGFGGGGERRHCSQRTSQKCHHICTCIK